MPPNNIVPIIVIFANILFKLLSRRYGNIIICTKVDMACNSWLLKSYVNKAMSIQVSLMLYYNWQMKFNYCTSKLNKILITHNQHIKMKVQNIIQRNMYIYEHENLLLWNFISLLYLKLISDATATISVKTLDFITNKLNNLL